MPKNILLLEDDPQQAETFQRKLRTRYSGATVEHMESEWELYEFVEKIRRGEAVPPDVVVADVMMPWVIATPNPPPVPEAVEQSGYSEAGVRCLKRFRQHINVPVPWVLFTCRDPKALWEEIKDLKDAVKTAVLNKEQPLKELFQEIDNLCGMGEKTDKKETD